MACASSSGRCRTSCPWVKARAAELLCGTGQRRHPRGAGRVLAKGCRPPGGLLPDAGSGRRLPARSAAAHTAGEPATRPRSAGRCSAWVMLSASFPPPRSTRCMSSSRAAPVSCWMAGLKAMRSRRCWDSMPWWVPFKARTRPAVAMCLLHHAFGETNGKTGAWGHAIGGMGSITQAHGPGGHAAWRGDPPGCRRRAGTAQAGTRATARLAPPVCCSRMAAKSRAAPHCRKRQSQTAVHPAGRCGSCCRRISARVSSGSAASRPLSA